MDSLNNNKNEFNFLDIHGAAQYDSTNEDVQKGSLVSKKHMKPFRFKLDKSSSHILVLGPIGSGKGVTVSLIDRQKIRDSLTFKSSKIVLDMLKEEIAMNSEPSDFTIQDFT